MKRLSPYLLIGFISFTFFITGSAQTVNEPPKPKWDYQIYLKQPAKEIKEILYEKDCAPVKGSLSQDKKTIILKDYEEGKRVYVKVVYEDGTEEEFTKSSCFIDPVI